MESSVRNVLNMDPVEFCELVLGCPLLESQKEVVRMLWKVDSRKLPFGYKDLLEGYRFGGSKG